MNDSPKVDHVRPEISEMLDIWKQIDTCEKGSKAVKAAGETYLPKPGCSDDPEIIKKNYEAYKKRAVFYNVLARTKRGMIGQVYNTPPKIELPTLIDEMQFNTDGSGATLVKQSKKTLGKVLSNGRAGLLSDFPIIQEGQILSKADTVLPRIIRYDAEQIINWSEIFHNGRNILEFVILVESYVKDSDGYEQELDTQFRELRFLPESDNIVVKIWRKSKDNGNSFEQHGDDSFLVDHKGNYFSEIPFVFVGTEDNDSEIDQPPLYDLSEVNIAHYRNSADYEESAFLVGQPTPYFSGLTQAWVDKNFKGKVILGSKSAASLPVNGVAGMLQASPNTLVKEAMMHKEDQMKALGAKLVEPKTGGRTATESEIEAGADSSVLSTIANNVSEAYKKSLFFCSLFLGEVNEDEIIFELNTDFAVNKMTAQERQQLITEWQSGAITFEEMRTNQLKDGIATIADHEQAKGEMEEQIINSGFDSP